MFLPTVARAALFHAYAGKAILLTTPERLIHYRSSDLGTVAINPDLQDWHDLPDHVVLDVGTALDFFPADPAAHTLLLVVGNEYPREALLQRLEALGYDRDEWRISGDTVEIETENGGVRLEFFGDELDTLRTKSGGEDWQKRGRFVLPPAREYLTEVSWDATRLQLLEGRVFLDAPEFYPSVLGVMTDGLWAALEKREVTSFGRSPLALPDLSTDLQTLPFYRARLSELEKDLAEWCENGYRVYLLVRHERTARYLSEKWERELTWLQQAALDAGEWGFLRSGGEGGFVIPEHRTVVITEDLIYGFGASSGDRVRGLAGKPVTDALGLHVGDFLIHPEHGIGRFEGLETRTVLGITRDYINIEYRAGSRLSVPIELLPLLRRHTANTDNPPALSSFDKKDWSRAKERARKNAEEVASRLLVQYAARQVTSGYAFTPQPEWDEQIELNFEHDLTPDQAHALKETLADLEAAHPADRLISGDVGFGKTEVALRAAHRVVGHGKQVALLVPTTLLAEQHLSTFVARFKGLPVRVEGLSRFSDPKQTRVVLADLAAGKVDILIGTHRLLSGDIEFKDLGLMIIDEEHRFGVGQKEKLRRLRRLPEFKEGELMSTEHAVDTISLSATPIPRTLYMSMVGLRDMSSIQTPPKGRKPIRTILTEFDPMTIRDAILTEIERAGKVFYIHDRVASIGQRSLYLRNLVPEARIGVAHGRMNEEELEEIMLGFEQGAFDVLLATTIVETGLDIPEANTILIERADRLGLAQLYQLRGRVGRRDLEAYAYLFYPEQLTENAQRRLWAIGDLQDLGSGHLLAEKDMEIRGVGNILGEAQHGHVQAVSIEVYTELLAEAVAKLKGETHTEAGGAGLSIDLPVHARLSPEYFEHDEEARVAAYGRLSEVRTLQALSRFERDLRKRYGLPTPEVQNFIDLAKLRLHAAAHRAVSISSTMTDIQITFGYSSLDYDALALRKLPYRTEVFPFPPSVKIDKRGLKPEDYIKVIIEVLNLFA